MPQCPLCGSSFFVSAELCGCLRQHRFSLKVSAPHEGIVRDEDIVPEKKKIDVGVPSDISARSGWNDISANQMARTGAGNQVYRGES